MIILIHVVVVLSGADLCGLFPAAKGVLVVGGWLGWSVCGDRVVDGGDRCMAWRGCCVVSICVICFQRL